MSRPLIIGVGNRGRGDDGIGPHVVDLVEASVGDRVDTAVVEADLSALALRWDPDRSVVVIDAMVSGRAPGTIEIVDGLNGDLGAVGRPLSSHGVGLAEAIGLARVLGRLPRELTIVLIEGAVYGNLEPLSAEVEAAAVEVADRIASGGTLASASAG